MATAKLTHRRHKRPKRYVRCSIGLFLGRRIYNSTVIVGIVLDDLFHPLGTGTLFRTKSRVICITAAHVVRQARQSEGPIGIVCRDSRLLLIHPGDDSDSSAAIRLAPEPADAALIQLPSGISGSISMNPILDWPMDEEETSPAEVVYCLLGYSVNTLKGPWSRYSMPQTMPPSHFTATQYEGVTQGLAGYHPYFHLLFGFGWHTSAERGPEVSGTEDFLGGTSLLVDFPSGMAGMSGCTVWKLKPVNAGQPGRVKEPQGIVALQTGLYASTRIIKATRWAVVSSLLQPEAA